MSALRLPRAPQATEALVFLAGTLALSAFTLAAFGRPKVFVLVVATVGIATLVYLSAGERLPVALLLLMLYLGLGDGYLKLSTGDDLSIVARDLFLLTITAVGAARLATTRSRIDAPPWTGLVLLWVGLVLVFGLHPDTPGIKGLIGGLRQHVGFVPLFFLGYAVVRTERRLRAFFLVLLVITAANAVVAVIQYNLTPQEFAGWGPGYKAKILGTGEFSQAARTFTDSAGQARVRPFGLAADTGGSGIFGWLAAGGALAFIAAAKTPFGRLAGFAGIAACAVGIIAAQSRGVILLALVAVAAFSIVVAGTRQSLRLAVTITVGIAIVAAAISVFASHQQEGSFSRLTSLRPGEVRGTIESGRGGSIAAIPEYMFEHPLGVGEGRVGPASGYAGKPSGLTAEVEPTFLIGELGDPGLIVFLALWLRVVAAAVRVTRECRVPNLRLLLAAAAAALLTMSASWFGLPTSAAPPTAPVFWLLAGVVAYAYRYGPEAFLTSGREAPVLR